MDFQTTHCYRFVDHSRLVGVVCATKIFARCYRGDGDGIIAHAVLPVNGGKGMELGPVKRNFSYSIGRRCRRKVPWGILLLFGGGFALAGRIWQDRVGSMDRQSIVRSRDHAIGVGDIESSVSVLHF